MGQSVNKVSTQVELLFDIAKSETLSEDQKTIIFHKLKIGSQAKEYSPLKVTELVVN